MSRSKSNASASRPILVVGSLNIDLVGRAPRLPRPGETIIGGEFASFPGGKGANQAVAAARLGGRVFMVGRVGDDEYGKRLRLGLEADGVDTGQVRVTPGTASGTAMIVVGGRGENSIVVAPGANARLAPADIDAAEGLIRRAGALLIQLEIPLAAVQRAIELARRHGVPVILDPAPAPARGLPPALLQVAVLTPNRLEARALLGGRGARWAARGPAAVARALLARGPQAVVLKLGKAGALYAVRGSPPRRVAGLRVQPVDTTAAGDAFTAALAVALGEGGSLGEAVRFANAAGALACTVPGAQPSLPRRRALERWLRAAAAPVDR